jgi:hypothetical protein
MDQDEGGYICEASNAAGPPLRSSTLLQLTEPVSIVKSPKDARVEEGARVSMSCEARGRPPPQQYWVFNGNAVSNDTHVIITGTLVMMDDGIFQQQQHQKEPVHITMIGISFSFGG